MSDWTALAQDTALFELTDWSDVASIEVFGFDGDSARQTWTGATSLFTTDAPPKLSMFSPDAVSVRRFAVIVTSLDGRQTTIHLDWDRSSQTFVVERWSSELYPAPLIMTHMPGDYVPPYLAVDFSDAASSYLLTGEGASPGVERVTQWASESSSTRLVWFDASSAGEALRVRCFVPLHGSRRTEWFETRAPVPAASGIHPLRTLFELLERTGRDQPGEVRRACIIADGTLTGPGPFHDGMTFGPSIVPAATEFVSAAADIDRAFDADGRIEFRHPGTTSDTAALVTLEDAERLGRGMARRWEVLARLYALYRGAQDELDGGHETDEVVEQLNASLAASFGARSPDEIWTQTFALEREVEGIELELARETVTSDILDPLGESAADSATVTARLGEIEALMRAHAALRDGSEPVASGGTVDAMMRDARSFWSQPTLARDLAAVLTVPVFEPPPGGEPSNELSTFELSAFTALHARLGGHVDLTAGLLSAAPLPEPPTTVADSFVPLLDMAVLSDLSTAAGVFRSTAALEAAHLDWVDRIQDTVVDDDDRLKWFTGKGPGLKPVPAGPYTLDAPWAEAAFESNQAAAQALASMARTRSVVTRGDRNELSIQSSFRSYTQQQGGFMNGRSEASALKQKAAPGTSRHHYGTDFDIFIVTHEEGSTEPEWNDALREHLSYERTVGYEWTARYGAYFGLVQPFAESRFRRVRTTALTTTTADPSHYTRGYTEERWHWSYWPIAQAILVDIASRFTDMDARLQTLWTGLDYDISKKYWPDYVFNVEQRLDIDGAFPCTRHDLVWRDRGVSR